MSIDWKRYLLNSDISEASKKMYISQIDCLIESTKQPIEWIMSHPVEVLSAMEREDYSESMKKNRISSICSLFKHWDEAASEFPEERTAWANAQKSMNKQSMERTLTGDPSEREILNWVPWKKVLATESVLRKTECGSWRHLLLAMYTHIEPMRGDFGHVKIYTSEPPACETEQNNYLYLAPAQGQSRICLNEYKTSRKYGQFSRTIPESLVFIMTQSLREDPRDYLFVDVHGAPYAKKNSFVKFANRMLYSIFGKHMTISLLRHSFISAIDFNKSNAGDLMNVSRNMQHSIEMQQYYRRNVPEMQVALRDDRETRRAERRAKKKEKQRRETVHQPRPYTDHEGHRVYYV